MTSLVPSPSNDARDWGNSVLADGRAAETPDEVAAKFQAMTPFEKEHAKIGLRSDMNRLLGAASGPVGVPNNPLNAIRGNMPAKIRGILGPEADPLLQRMGIGNNDWRDWSYMEPRTGSATVGTGADAADMTSQFAKAIAGSNPLDAAWHHATRAVGAAADKFIAPWQEAARNAQGAELFAPMTPERAAMLTRQMRAEQTARQTQALAMALSSTSNGVRDPSSRYQQ